MAIQLSSPAVDAFDRLVDSRFDQLRSNRVANRIFYVASEAANHSLLWHGITWGYVGIAKGDWRRAAKVSAVLGAESAIVNGPLKMLFRRRRPMHSGDRPHHLRIPKTSSFPSGHATSAMCAAGLLRTCGVPAPLIYGLGGIVALSRVHVGIHHASDVLAGAAIGATCGALTKRIVS